MVSIEIAPRCAAHCPTPRECDTLSRQPGEAGEKDTPFQHRRDGSAAARCHVILPIAMIQGTAA
jgi:hypothetical protein